MRFLWTTPAKLIVMGLAALVTSIALGIGILSSVILHNQSTSSWARTFIRVVPVPAASVNGAWLSYKDILQRWDDIDQALARQSLADPSLQVRPVAELRQEAYEQLIRETYLKHQAEEEKFSLSEDIVQQNLERVLLQGATSTPLALAQATQTLQEQLGWTADMFRDRIIRPATLEEALATRSEVGGVTREAWLQQIQVALHGEKVKRYLVFPAL